MEHIYFSGASPFPYQDIEFAFEKLGPHPKSIRMKLVLTMLGCVYHGKNKNIQSLKKWRDRGFDLIDIFKNSSSFNEFEKKLMISRFYRAVSFYPYLIKDDATLRKEAEICESNARSLTPETEKQKLLYKENLFPMMESMARTFAHLGEFKVSLNLMEEIVNQVDPFDAKAWIQVGELREKNGELERALEAFQCAIDLSMPLGAIACFRAGRVSEKLEDFRKAKHYYIRSLKFCPKGLSPLQRLNAISKKMGDSYLKDWSESNLNSLRLHFG